MLKSDNWYVNLSMCANNINCHLNIGCYSDSLFIHPWIVSVYDQSQTGP